MDVAPIEGISLPIFNPLFGFNSITAPGLSVETADITEGNWLYGRKVVKRAQVDAMTLTRGVTFYDSDFWRWITAAVTGNTMNFRMNLLPDLPIGGVSPRRKLLLIHFFARNPGINAVAASIGGYVAATAGGGSFNAVAAASAATLASFGFGAIGPFQLAARMPAKAWLLHGCIPTRFKSGGDFDASSGEVSVAELEVAPEMIEEISLSS